MTEPKDRTAAEWRDDLIEVVMMHAAFDGWNEATLARAGRDLGLEDGFVRLVFPGGVPDALSHMTERANRLMREEAARRGVQDMRIRDRIRTLVAIRLEQAVPYREAVRGALAHLALPHNAALSARLLWRAADAIWRAAGDRATDYNHYTKRLILSGVYSATLVVWTGDRSEGFGDTLAFLDRRIDNVMQFEKLKASARRTADGMPSLVRFLGRLRYGTR